MSDEKQTLHDALEHLRSHRECEGCGKEMVCLGPDLTKPPAGIWVHSHTKDVLCLTTDYDIHNGTTTDDPASTDRDYTSEEIEQLEADMKYRIYKECDAEDAALAGATPEEGAKETQR